MKNERWMPVTGYKGLYDVSDLGRVRSLERMVPSSAGAGIQRAGGSFLRGYRTNGYPTVSLCRNGVASKHKVHRLVLLSFVGTAPDGFVACHWNGVRDDNRLANLRWDSRSANEADRVRHGTSNRGERQGSSKLTEAAVLEIRDSLALGERHRDIAQRHGVHPGTISKLACGTRWAWLPAGEVQP